MFKLSCAACTDSLVAAKPATIAAWAKAHPAICEGVLRPGEESWRPCPGAGGHYEISSFGRARRIGGRILVDNTGTAFIAERPTRHLRVSLCVSGRLKPAMAHDLVGAAFLPPPPSEAYRIEHLDGGCKDNRLENLAWVDRADLTTGWARKQAPCLSTGFRFAPRLGARVSASAPPEASQEAP